MGSALLVLGVVEADAVLLGIFGGGTNHDVKVYHQFAGLGTFYRGKVTDEQVAQLGVSDGADGTVALEGGVALDVKLGGKDALVVADDCEMNVPGTAAVRGGLDGPEVVFAGTAGEESTEALEVLVAVSSLGGLGMDVDAAAVDLPDFHKGVANRSTALFEDAAAQMGDFPHGRRCRLIDDQEIIIGIQRKVVWV